MSKSDKYVGPQPVVEYEFLPEVMPTDYFNGTDKSTHGFYSAQKKCNNCQTTFHVYVKGGNLVIADAGYSNTKRHSFKCRNCQCVTIHFFTQLDTAVEGSK